LQVLGCFGLFRELEKVAELRCEHDADVVRGGEEELAAFVDSVDSSVGEGAVYVGVPAQQQIVEVHPEEAVIARRMEVSGTPSSIAVLALEGGTVH
jgi:hypothetical protein